MNGQTQQRWRAILLEMLANTHNRLTDRERRRVADAIDSVEHAGALRQLALDTAASCGRRSVPGSTSPFPQPDLTDAFSKAALRSGRAQEKFESASVAPIEHNQSSIQPLRQNNRSGANALGPSSDQTRVPPPARPAPRGSTPR
jgi:hypothetical protein